MTLQEHYNVLSLPPGVDKAAIREAYKRLAKKYHPDINNSRDAQEKFILVKNAYDTLMRQDDYTLRHSTRPLTKAEFYEKQYKQKMQARRASQTPAGNAYNTYRTASNRTQKAKPHPPLYYLSRYLAFILVAFTLDLFIERNFVLFGGLSFICLPSAYYLLKWSRSLS